MIKGGQGASGAVANYKRVIIDYITTKKVYHFEELR